jgi:hypothetical protein
MAAKSSAWVRWTQELARWQRDVDEWLAHLEARRRAVGNGRPAASPGLGR